MLEESGCLREAAGLREDSPGPVKCSWGAGSCCPIWQPLPWPHDLSVGGEEGRGAGPNPCQHESDQYLPGRQNEEDTTHNGCHPGKRVIRDAKNFIKKITKDKKELLTKLKSMPVF